MYFLFSVGEPREYVKLQMKIQMKKRRGIFFTVKNNISLRKLFGEGSEIDWP